MRTNAEKGDLPEMWGKHERVMISAHTLGGADAPTPEMVRTARRGLGLDEEGEIEVPGLELRQPRGILPTVSDY